MKTQGQRKTPSSSLVPLHYWCLCVTPECSYILSQNTHSHPHLFLAHSCWTQKAALLAKLLVEHCASQACISCYNMQKKRATHIKTTHAQSGKWQLLKAVTLTSPDNLWAGIIGNIYCFFLKLPLIFLDLTAALFANTISFDLSSSLVTLCHCFHH